MPASDYGKDISVNPDLDPSFSVRPGNNAMLAEAIWRRLQTQRGMLQDDPKYGTDLRVFLNDSQTPAQAAQIKTAVESECMKDERIASASASVTYDGVNGILKISLSLDAADGPFQLLLSVTAVTVTLLQVA